MWPSSWYSTCLSNEELFKIVKKKKLLPSDICYVNILPPGIEQGVFNCASTPQDLPHLRPRQKNCGSILFRLGAVFMISPGRHTMWWMMQVNLIVHGNACECDPCGPWGGSLWIRGTYACHQGRHLRPYTQFSAPCITYTTIWQYGILLIRLHWIVIPFN